MPHGIQRGDHIMLPLTEKEGVPNWWLKVQEVYTVLGSDAWSSSPTNGSPDIMSDFV